MSAARAAVYLRVSTGRQAEHELSIPDQRAQCLAWIRQRGWAAVAEYLEAGASATDDKRPEFQRMIERACDGENAFDVIVVHSFSRFFRDAFGLEFYVRKLAKHNVRLVSMTQELGDDPAQVMMRQVIAMFDEYQSKENAKHVLRSMKENARQGYWNGARPPFGFKAVEVERRGNRVKKKLDIDPVEAETVRLIFRLFLVGDEDCGPMGVKSIVVWLNEHGYRTRGGSTWAIGPLHALLSNPVYSGRMQPDTTFAQGMVLQAMGLDAGELLARRASWDPASGTPPPPGQAHVGSNSGTYSIESRARLRNGRESVLRAVIRAGGNGIPGSAYTPLRWEEGASPR